MNVIYQLLGAFGLLSGLLWGIYYLLRSNTTLKAENAALTAESKADAKVIKELTKPVPSANDVADSLHKGTF